MYSQNNEEEIILKYFSEYEKRRGDKPNVLSIGENDGIHLSNVRALIERGSAAILVEPAPIAFKKLFSLYADSKFVFCYRVAIANFTDSAILYDSDSHLDGTDTSLLSTLLKEETKRWGDTQKFTETAVLVQTWKDFIRLKPMHIFDLISIDAEGYDLIILKQMNLSQLKASMVIVEWNGKDFDEFDNYFKKYLFKLHHKNAENLIYVSERHDRNYE